MIVGVAAWFVMFLVLFSLHTIDGASLNQDRT